MNSIKILMADDEGRMRKLVSDFLRKEGYFVIEAEDGKQAIQIFNKEENLSLVILDVMMPEYDGWTVCREIRKTSKVPIIMLTARGEESDELFGFELGADDYVTKPFSPMVLVARVQALLRRIDVPILEKSNFGQLELDRNRHVVKVLGERVELSPKEFELLEYFSENEGIALTREQILNSVWNYDYFGDIRTVDTHVKRLRIKLGKIGEYIQTVRGLGYRFEVIK